MQVGGAAAICRIDVRGFAVELILSPLLRAVLKFFHPWSCSMKLPYRALCIAALAVLNSGAHAHVTWTQTNLYDPDALAVWSLNDTSFLTGDSLLPVSGYPNANALEILTGAGTFSSSNSAPEPFFGSSLRMDGVRRADSFNENFGYWDRNHPDQSNPQTPAPGNNNLGPDLITGDLTIEFWMKWDPAPSASSFEVGFRRGSKLRITRDTANPANDRFAIFATHGTFVSAPGFTNWADVGIDEAPLDEWIHVAVAIDSVGNYYDDTVTHHLYNTGSVARFFLNGHAVGNAPHTVQLNGNPDTMNNLQIHGEYSKLTINNISGVVTLDDVAVWSRDLTEGGTVMNPFANGRGTVFSAVEGWSVFG
jgi:hypothetical protein